MSGPPTVRIAVASRPDNVALIREVLAGLAEGVDFGGVLDDVKAAVSEACNNVVVHAYGGEEGPLEVDVRLLGDELEVLVRDRGVGLQTLVVGEQSGEGASSGRGLGLPVMEALADRVELRESDPQGTEVELRFTLPSAGEFAQTVDDDAPVRLGPLAASGSTLRIALSPPTLCAAVLARLMTAAAARADFSLDRLSDAQLVADALSAHLDPVLSEPAVSFGIGVSRRRLEVELGPLKRGGSRDTIAASAVGDIGPLIERLSDEVVVRETGRGELLGVVMVDRRGVPR